MGRAPALLPPAARAPCGGRGPGKGARWGRGRAAAASASCAPGRSRCTSRPPLPPEPGPDPGPKWVVWGGGERGRLRRSGRVGSRQSPAAWEVLEVRGMGRNPAIRSCSGLAFTWYPFPQMRPKRGPRCGASPRPHLCPGPRASSAPRARPPPPQTGFSALLGSVGTSPFDSPFQFIFLGLYFAERAQRKVAFFPYPAPARARFPAPTRAWVPPLAGSGAGCTRVAVHAVGVHRFPAPARAPLPPRILAPSPASGPAMAKRRHLQSHAGSEGWSWGPQGLKPPRPERKVAG